MQNEQMCELQDLPVSAEVSAEDRALVASDDLRHRGLPERNVHGGQDAGTVLFCL